MFCEVLDDNVIFVVVEISFDLMKERLSARENAEMAEMLTAMLEIYKPAQSNEPKTVAFKVLKEATVGENAPKIIILIN